MEKKDKCWFRHKWGKWDNPFTPNGFLSSYAIQRRTCERCNKTQQRTV